MSKKVELFQRVLELECDMSMHSNMVFDLTLVLDHVSTTIKARPYTSEGYAELMRLRAIVDVVRRDLCNMHVSMITSLEGED